MQQSMSTTLVTYHGFDAARRCVESIIKANERPSKHFKCEQVIIMDSASGDGTPNKLGVAYPQVQVHLMDENRGVDRAAGDLLLVLNPDTIIGFELLDSLAAYMGKGEYVARVGPKIVNANGNGAERHSVIHEGGISAKSDGQVEENGWLGEHFFASRRRYFKKHHGISYAMTVEFVHSTRKIVRAARSKFSSLGEVA
ncbi:MAG: hypothetical protein ACI97A_004128 [Planctomycetota bacterium]|jgi:hypothetical protein